MAKKQGNVRRTISLPADLDRWMEKQSGVNWSEVARSAFELKRSELEPKRKEMTPMESTIERLKKLKSEESSQAAAYGRECGRDWAMQLATPKQLERLEKFDEFSTSVVSQSDNPGWATAREILGSDVDQDEIHSFWESAAGDDWKEYVTDTEFVFAFIGAALEVWSEVKDLI